MLIGFAGAPGCGKSTTSFGLCYKLKKEGYATEFFAEYARPHIMECRVSGVPRTGGYEGQTIIYGRDNRNALLYRDYADALSITDGCTINCSFYNGFNHLDLVEEARKYDLIFYIPLTDVSAIQRDANRIENTGEILALGAEWERALRPLMQRLPHIVELSGYPQMTQDNMVANAYAVVEERFLKKRMAA